MLLNAKLENGITDFEKKLSFKNGFVHNGNRQEALETSAGPPGLNQPIL